MINKQDHKAIDCIADIEIAVFVVGLKSFYVDFFEGFLYHIQTGDGQGLVFTIDGVVVGIIIRNVERYDPVKIKPKESKAERRFCL